MGCCISAMPSGLARGFGTSNVTLAAISFALLSSGNGIVLMGPNLKRNVSTLDL